MDFYSTTLEYYAHFIGLSADDIANCGKGIHFVRNTALDNTLMGYSQPIDMHIFQMNDRTFVSCSDRACGFISDYEDEKTLADLIKNNPRKYKYFFGGGPMQSSAKTLGKDDFSAYEVFFKTCNPYCKNTDWLYEYFIEMTEREYCFGVFSDGILVSASDSPDVPFCNDCVAEIGINTLQEYRRSGYAGEVCAAHINSLLKRNITPLWSADSMNTGSQVLAERLGFIKMAEVTEITLAR